MSWTAERVELLTNLWTEGLSASQIAGKMGGITRNAVIGKVHRLGLPGRATPANPRCSRSGARSKQADANNSSYKTAAGKKRSRNGAGKISALSTPPGPATVATIGNNMCRWPIGDPAGTDFHFCGEPTLPGKPYCARHAHIAFQPSRQTGSTDERRKQGILQDSTVKKRAAG